MLKPTLRVKCNSCGLLNTKAYVVRNDLAIVRCAGCGLLYTNPQLATQDLPSLYSQDYFKSNNPLEIGYQDYLKERGNVEKEASYYLEIMSKFINLKKAKLIEVGCAFGFFLNKARETGLDVYGVEISDFAAKAAGENFGLKVYTGHFPKIKLPHDFDVIVMWTTLEHTNDPLAYLKKAWQLLRPGGLLFVSVPNAGGIFARLTGKRWPGFQKIQEHNYFFTFASLSNLLQKAGFEIIGKKGAPFFCRLDFLGEKIAAYSQVLSKILIKLIELANLSGYSLNFGLIDMLVIARKK